MQRLFYQLLILTLTLSQSFAQDNSASHSSKIALNSAFITDNLTAAVEVEKYDVFEIQLFGPNLNVNKYTDVWVKGRFQGPSKVIEIFGFWDGGDTWRIRMSPTEIGEWTYTLTSSHSQLKSSGSFNCIPSESKGFIRPDPQNPYIFSYEDGTPWLWKGETSWRGFTDQVAFESRYKPYIDRRASQGFNTVQSILVSYINDPGFWKNEGGFIFEENSDGKDYDRLNPAYFQWVDKRIEYALSKGVIPVIFFSWAQEVMNFSTLQFERFEQYVVSRYAAYNVFWCLSGEYNEVYEDFNKSPEMWDHYGGFVYDFDPYHHPITLHPTGQSSCSEFSDRKWLGFIMQQSDNWHMDVRRERRFSKPVINGEYGYAGVIADESVRKGAWGIFTGGGFFTAGFYKTFAPDKGGWDLEANTQQANELTWLFDFMDETAWWEMEPNDSLVTNGHCLAKQGNEYIVYSQDGGGVDIDLSAVSGNIPVQWFNPSNGNYSERYYVPGGNKMTFVPPFEGDWVLHIGEGSRRDTIAPNPPRNLNGQPLNMTSIQLSWSEPLPADDGDIASSYIIYRDEEELSSTNEMTYIDKQLRENTSYLYKVYAVDKKGNLSLDAASISVTTLADNGPPILVSANLVNETTLIVEFSEPVEQESAINKDNYEIIQGVAIKSINFANELNKVIIATDAHVLPGTYTLRVNNIMDRASLPNMIAFNSEINYQWVQQFRISELNPNTYLIDSLKLGDKYYTDRDYTLSYVPDEFTNLLWICTENDDKDVADKYWITFNVNKAVSVYVAYDASFAQLPAWLQNWKNTGKFISTTDDTKLDIYSRNFPAGTVVLGGNYGDDRTSMYVVLLKSGISSDLIPPQPPTGLGLISE